MSEECFADLSIASRVTMVWHEQGHAVMRCGCSRYVSRRKCTSGSIVEV